MTGYTHMNNLAIVLALFTTPNHRFSRLGTTAAFQAELQAFNFKLGSAELFPNLWNSLIIHEENTKEIHI